MNTQIYTPKQGYKVLVRCYTYNHSKYIEDAINGFAMQKTDFPFVCLVVDDCSTDGEQDVIKAWLERECDMTKAEYIEIELANIILVPHKLNVNCNFAVYLLKKNLFGNPLKSELIKPWREHCEYEALCEGDDYWIKDAKLQKQVQILLQNAKVGLVYSSVNTIDESGAVTGTIKAEEVSFKSMMISNPISTLSTCYKIDILSKYMSEVNPSDKKWMMGDYPMWLYFVLHCDVALIEDCTANYRVLNGSATHSQTLSKRLAFVQSTFDIKTFFINRYIVPTYQAQTLYRIINKIKISEQIDAYIDTNNRLKGLKYLLGEYIFLLKMIVKVLLKF